jgi:hypothetical protein
MPAETTHLTDDNLVELAHTHLAAHPDATSLDVYQAIRDSGYEGVLQSFQVHNACEKIRPIPTLAAADDAVALMNRLAERYEWVSVFWDRGWGDSGQPLEISIIVDGDGQAPLAWLTRDVYRELLAQQAIQPNSYGGYKARKLHDFQTPKGE